MSFERPYPNRKDRRQPYRHSARDLQSCRPHGGCPWCLDNRRYASRKASARAEDSRKDWESS
jgi:hypothetical protein